MGTLSLLDLKRRWQICIFGPLDNVLEDVEAKTSDSRTKLTTADKTPHQELLHSNMVHQKITSKPLLIPVKQETFELLN